ncbi:MAG: ferrous iron transport protein A [Clostridiaceae bacterium]|nr:ferrous iron transport protein A [Clostridiaceae bacterium]
MQSKSLLPLSEVPIGTTARVKKIHSRGTTRRRMLDLGIILNTEIEALQKSPSGDPVAYYIRGAVIALRKEESSKILVEV